MLVSTEVKKLQDLQNPAARIAKNSSYDVPSKQFLKWLGWKTIGGLITI